MALFGSLAVARDLHRLQGEVAQLVRDTYSLVQRIETLERERAQRELELHDLRTKYLNAVKRISIRAERANSLPDASDPATKGDPWDNDVLSLRRNLGK